MPALVQPDQAARHRPLRPGHAFREPGQAGIDFFPPALLIADKESAYLKITEDKEKGRGEGTLSIKDIYPFVPADSSFLVGDLEDGVEKILAVLRCRVRDKPEAGLKIAARLTDSAKSEIPVSHSLLTGKKEGRTWIFLTSRVSWKPCSNGCT